LIIKDSKFRQAILTALADSEMLDIINHTMYQPRSFNNIVKETNIPNTTTFRKIKLLLDDGLLVTEKFHITKDGKKSSLFRSTLRSIVVRYENNQVMVEAEKNIDVMAKTTARFFSLDSE
jgi:predicted transcriptional regulator